MIPTFVYFLMDLPFLRTLLLLITSVTQLNEPVILSEEKVYAALTFAKQTTEIAVE